MKITTKTRYGLRALVYIAENSTDEKLVRIKEISLEEKISVQYLEQILYKLKKNMIIAGKRGPNGGYKLIKTPEEIKIYDVFKVLETEVKMVVCDLEGEKCAKDRCSTIYLWNKLNKSLEEILKETSLQELINNQKA